MTRELSAIAGQTPSRLAPAVESFASVLRAEPRERPA